MTRKALMPAYPSWERRRWDGVHSPEGIEAIRITSKTALHEKYAGIMQQMFRYDFTSEKLQDMPVMSADRVPERFMSQNGKAVWFEYGGQVHCLPFTWKEDLNIYGLLTKRQPMPVGYVVEKAGTYSEAVEKIRNLNLDDDNSVVMYNNRFGTSEMEFVDMMIEELVDNMLTVNQLQLLARMPFHFNITKDNEMSAKNYYRSIAEGDPVIFTNAFGEDITPAVETNGVTIDPSIFEIFDRWECAILEMIGIPCVPITKRAQQTVSEVTSSDDKIWLRRLEKLEMRQKAIDRVNKMFGTDITVVSVIDEQIEKEQQMQMDEKEADDNESEE